MSYAGVRGSPAGWGALLAVSGLYLLSVREGFTVSPGDLLVLASAVFWALHVLIIDLYGRYVDSIELSIIQFALCSVLCGVTALGFEDPGFQGILTAAVPILYGGLFSVGDRPIPCRLWPRRMLRPPMRRFC